jgi:hypothetical protein
MKLEKLVTLYDECRHNENYQFKDLTDDEFVEKAYKSFDKLKKSQKDKVTKLWGETTGDTSKASGIAMLRYRFLAQTNLYFLCHLLEQYNQTTLTTHEEICNKFFVPKDPTYITFDHFADQYTDLKQSMLLVPRGGFKSSLNMADTVQWIICFPAITIAILTGVLRLATDFVGVSIHTQHRCRVMG